MNAFPYRPAPSPPPPPVSALPSDPPPSAGFWNVVNVRNQLEELLDTLHLAKAMERELEVLMRVKDFKASEEDNAEESPVDLSASDVFKSLECRNVDLESQELLSIEEAESLISKLKMQLEPFRIVVDEKSPWEEKSAMVRLGGKINKSKRNRLWRKRKKRRVAEMRAKERERYDQADQEADEWMAREMAKDGAKRRVEKMKEIAKVKAKEERKRLESELEQVWIVEKLQELRSIRIQKLKKQGHFLPEEDDKFLERVRAAVEEEERQAVAAAATVAAKGADATAEETRKNVQNQDISKEEMVAWDPESRDKTEKGRSTIPISEVPKKRETEGQSYGSTFDNVANLPMEYYHYYHGSNYDMGTLIEVRRAWDAYLRPGGSRIPGHWVRPPPPANEIWASYLVKPK